MPILCCQWILYVPFQYVYKISICDCYFFLIFLVSYFFLFRMWHPCESKSMCRLSLSLVTLQGRGSQILGREQHWGCSSPLCTMTSVSSHTIRMPACWLGNSPFSLPPGLSNHDATPRLHESAYFRGLLRAASHTASCPPGSPIMLFVIASFERLNNIWLCVQTCSLALE